MKRFLLFIFIIFFFSIYAQDVQIYTVEEAPSSFVEPSGVISGYSVDIVKELQRRVGNKSEIKIAPEIRVLKIADYNPNILIFSFSRTEAREKKYHWILKVIEKPWVIYTRSDRELPIKTLDDARIIKSLGVVRGDVRSEYLEALGFNNIYYIPGYNQAIRMLYNNRIDAFFFEPQGMRYYSTKVGVGFSNFTPNLYANNSDVYIAMSRNTDPEIVERWRRAANEMVQDGTVNSIANDWVDIISLKFGMDVELIDSSIRFK